MTPARQYAAMVARLTLLFAAVYGGCAWATSHYPRTLALHFEWERGIPFVPEMVFVYFSISLVFALPLFTLDVPALRRLERAFAACTLLAGAGFLALNAAPGFDPASATSTNPVVQAMRLVDTPRNLVPSLHVAYAALVLGTVAAGTESLAARGALAVWFVLLAASTLLVHQHHLLDVMTGTILGGAAAAWVVRADCTRPAIPVP